MLLVVKMSFSTPDRAELDQMTIPLNKLPCYFAGDDWDFEESMAELGCTVHAYDPYVKSPNTTRENLHFYEIGKEVLTCQMYTYPWTSRASGQNSSRRLCRPESERWPLTSL